MKSLTIFIFLLTTVATGNEQQCRKTTSDGNDKKIKNIENVENIENECEDFVIDSKDFVETGIIDESLNHLDQAKLCFR
jgi:hypothetical protein